MEKANILVCEDERIVAEDIERCLEMNGHHVVAIASNAEDALQIAAFAKPDLAIMDINLGAGQNGIEVARALKDKHGIPVLYLTAYADAATLDSAKITEPLGFLVKPFQERDLLSSIEIGLYKFHKQETLLMNKSESIRTLAAGVAHNINNSLCLVLGSVEYLSQKKDLDALELKFAELAREGCERAVSIVRQLICYSGPSPVQLTTIDCAELIEKILANSEKSLDHSVNFTHNVAHQEFHIVASQHLMQEALHNILKNADEAMKNGGVINVRLYDEHQPSPQQFNPDAVSGNYVVIEVTDSGVGINNNDLARVCEPFFTTKEVGDGLGLGLSLTHGVLQAQKGWLQIHSEQGQGTTVKLYMPSASLNSAKLSPKLKQDEH